MTDKLKTVITWPMTGVIVGVISAVLAIIFNYIPAQKLNANEYTPVYDTRIDILEQKVYSCKTDISDVMDEIFKLKNQNELILKYVLKLNGHNKEK